MVKARTSGWVGGRKRNTRDKKIEGEDGGERIGE